MDVYTLVMSYESKHKYGFTRQEACDLAIEAGVKDLDKFWDNVGHVTAPVIDGDIVYYGLDVITGIRATIDGTFDASLYSD